MNVLYIASVTMILRVINLVIFKPAFKNKNFKNLPILFNSQRTDNLSRKHCDWDFRFVAQKRFYFKIITITWKYQY